MRGQTRVTNSQAAVHESWLMKYFPCALGFNESIPIISDNGLPLLTEKNFQTSPQPPTPHTHTHTHARSFSWTPFEYLGYLSGPVLLLRPHPLLFGTGEYFSENLIYIIIYKYDIFEFKLYSL